MTAPRPRVLLIEDDAAMQRFVALVLQDFALELITVESVEAGLAELARGPVALVLSDLILPGLSGFDLVDRLAADPALRGPARIAVFSGGLDDAARRRLDRPEVWRLLNKPCQLEDLEDCVDDALAAYGAHWAATAPHAPTPAAPAPNDAAIADTIARHFGGDAQLYAIFRSACFERLEADIAAGDHASEAGDLGALHHLAHSLKSVLRMLGNPRESAVAFALEDACAHAESPADGLAAAQPLWQSLRRALSALH